MATPNLDQVCDDIRSRLTDCADRLRDAAIGHGVFADPQSVYLEINIVLTVLERVQSQMRRYVLGGGAP